MMQFCPWEQAQYFVYSSNIPTLFFYSHIPAVIISLLLGFFIFFKSGKSRLGQTLLTINILFSLWCFFDLILWATNRPDIVMFFWSMQVLIEPLIYLLGFYLAYLFIKKKDLSFRARLIGILIYLPVAVLLSTKYNLSGVDLYDCTAIEGFIAQYFTYIIEFVFIILILILMELGYKNTTDKIRQKEILTFGTGVIVFLLAFSWGNLIGSFTENWTLAQAGLIGMPLFVGFLSYHIVKFHTFNVKLFGAQALVAGLLFAVLGILFIRNIENVRIITLFTLFLVSIAGYSLVQSVKREIERKEELAKLNTQLESLIKQRESLMHLITHKVKGSFTHSKYIFAGILDGSFGEVNEEIKKRATQGIDSDDTGLKTIDLILNTTNMQKGLIKYDMKPLELRSIVALVDGEKKGRAEEKGLKLETHVPTDTFTILGDQFWIKEAVSNLVENSIKYTLKGTININLEKKNDKVLFSVTDTGVGISSEDKKVLFTEGGRGKDSVKVNVDSTGYGLYSVKLIIEAHKGRVWAESNGEEQGSTFFIELPLV